MYDKQFPHENLEGLTLPDVTPVMFPKIAGMFSDEYQALDPVLKGMYEYDPVTRLYALPEYEWLHWRDHGPYYGDKTHPLYQDVCLGGSDVSALLDGSSVLSRYQFYDGQHGSPYKCAAELFYEKSGMAWQMQEEKDPTVLFVGHNEEDAAARMFVYCYEKDHPADVVELVPDTHMYRSSEYPFMQCDLDYRIRINGLDGVLECKTATKGSEDYSLWKKGICPLKYYTQVQWYLSIMNLPYAYIVCKWGNLPTECVYIFIKRDMDYQKDIISLAESFVACVRKGTEPDNAGQNIARLNVLWRKKNGPVRPDAPILKLHGSLAPSVNYLKEINEQIDELNKQIEKLKKERNKVLNEDIFPVFGDSSRGNVIDPDTGKKLWITLKNKSSASFLDEVALKKEEPEIYDRYSYSERKFNKTLFVKEQPQLAARYTRQDLKLTDGKMNYCEVYEGN